MISTAAAPAPATPVAVGISRAPRRSIVCASARAPGPPQPSASAAAGRRQAMLAGVAGVLAFGSRPSAANSRGIEEAVPFILEPTELVKEIKAGNQKRLDAAESEFEQSTLLKSLLEKSDANRDMRAREIEDKYCKRGSEWGVGDCAGLQLIPGATKAGKQKLPFGWGE